MALAQLRRRARDKFPLADHMFFDREGLELASRQEIARYRAWRLRHREVILDLCCGIGGDLLELGIGARVRAVDRDRERLEMARMNAASAGLQTVDFIQADVRFIKPHGDAIFLDPSRRSGGRRIRAAEAYSPPLSCIEDLRRSVSALAVKVAPAIREEELPSGCEVEFISAGGQCREGVLYFGPLATTRRRRKLLRREGFFPEEIKKRRFPMDAQELRKLLKTHSGEYPVTLIATRICEQPVVAICKRVGN